ncbi:MAG: hypothetical protein H6Q15_1688 [Bacteroidetes bacterium]|nr:hypothetical protein [Bacteroidota bacterium]
MISEISNCVYPIQQFNIYDGKLGVAISTGILGFHCGICYKDLDKNQEYLLHLAFHFDLKNQNVSECENYYFVAPNLSELQHELISARLIALGMELPRIPYALRYLNTCLTKEGCLKLGDGEWGMTCATFVLALFKSCGVALCDVVTWPQRDEDENSHKNIVELLVEHKVRFKITQEHIENVRKEVGCARFRPEEVAASVTFNPIPGLNNDIIYRGKEIKEFILNCSNKKAGEN